MPTIGFIGLGNMGAPMAANLVKSGEHVLGFDVVPASRDASARDGVQIVASARSTVENADVVITMLPAGEHVLSVWDDIVPRGAAGHALHRLLDHRCRECAQGPRARRRARHRHARRSGFGRRRRRQGGDAHLHGRRLRSTPLRTASRCWSAWASASCIAARPATARWRRSATT